MASQYASFLKSPTTSLLAADASLVYITTTTEIKEPNAILKHLQSQQKLLDKKNEKILNTIAGQDGLCLETETTLLFKMGGGAYLPGIDENLLDEKLVTFPVMHIVRFDEAQKIKQIRLYWDQGTLLKQVEAIGRTGRNWPIRDGSSQLDAINKSLNAGGRVTDVEGSTASAPRKQSDVVINQHKKRESVSATRDPHASLNLFQSRDPNEDGPRKFDGPVTAPRETYKDITRDLAEIVGNENVGPGSANRDPSPSKQDGFYPKAGAGKTHNVNRLFDDNETTGAPPSPQRKKVFQDKNNHFEFGGGEDAPEHFRPGRGGKHNNNTQIDFTAFSVSPSVKGKSRPAYDRQWGPGVQEDDPPSPIKRPVVHAPRPDADPHFALADDSPAPEKQKSFARHKGMGLYQDPLQDDSRTAIGKNSHSRANAFEPHYSMADSSPADGHKTQHNATAKSNAARNDMDANWSFDTPVKEKAIYKTAGNGMGGRRDEDRGWGIGDESDPEVNGTVGDKMRARRGKQARAGAPGHAGY
ncbi:hypothetical protein LTR78_004538 [Recurvomyces mirabilis]|uniref:Uncharacterized protein n=1 Tax=Recurvomyces mirabilis TaxID=574656 RepID=A0AAE0WPK3_9PEZI|nr:hypothetical protein LTR78_004538 [Recurvomyces mirabilis]KAK5152968.1 hypothetical protein LTS14_008076 [Recurvomyces mirabilis]